MIGLELLKGQIDWWVRSDQQDREREKRRVFKIHCLEILCYLREDMIRAILYTHVLHICTSVVAESTYSFNGLNDLPKLKWVSYYVCIDSIYNVKGMFWQNVLTKCIIQM